MLSITSSFWLKIVSRVNGGKGSVVWGEVGVPGAILGIAPKEVKTATARAVRWLINSFTTVILSLTNLGG